MSTATYVTGDVRDCLAATPNGLVDLILTSPPFLALRSYLPADHPDKWREIGAEPDPAAFLQTLLELTAEFRRVLAPHGSICVELGDTYSASGGAGGDYSGDGMRDGQPVFAGSASRRGEWPLPKSMCGIPHLYHLSLAYGRNLLTGEPSPAGKWRIRNVVAWCRPNPPVGALGDKFRPATSYMTVACVSGSRYFDLDAVRHRNERDNERPTRAGPTGYDEPSPQNAAGAPPLDWWEIPTQGYSGSHYAVFPAALLERPIKSMVPKRVCTVCGEPSRRIAHTINAVTGAAGRYDEQTRRANSDDTNAWAKASGSQCTERETTGWTSCGHDAYRPGLVLDPFGGSGTTGMVATGHGVDALLFDLDRRNVELARERIGMFMESYDLADWQPAAVTA